MAHLINVLFIQIYIHMYFPVKVASFLSCFVLSYGFNNTSPSEVFLCITYLISSQYSVFEGALPLSTAAFFQTISATPCTMTICHMETTPEGHRQRCYQPVMMWHFISARLLVAPRTMQLHNCNYTSFLLGHTAEYFLTNVVDNTSVKNILELHCVFSWDFMLTGMLDDQE